MNVPSAPGRATRCARAGSRTAEHFAYGGFAILEPNRNYWVAGMSAFEYSMDLDAVEPWVAEE